MSGGSFNYLYAVEAYECLSRRSCYEEMRDALIHQHNAPDAAREIEDMLATMRQFEVLVGTRLERLRAVMKEVEWCRSGDTGPDAVQKRLVEYRQGMR